MSARGQHRMWSALSYVGIHEPGQQRSRTAGGGGRLSGSAVQSRVTGGTQETVRHTISSSALSVTEPMSESPSSSSSGTSGFELRVN